MMALNTGKLQLQQNGLDQTIFPCSNGPVKVENPSQICDSKTYSSSFELDLFHKEKWVKKNNNSETLDVTEYKFMAHFSCSCLLK